MASKFPHITKYVSLGKPFSAIYPISELLASLVRLYWSDSANKIRNTE